MKSNKVPRMDLKAETAKTSLTTFCFPFSAPGARIFKILVSTPHNTPLIIGDRDKNFEDPITGTQDIRKTKFDLLGFL